MQIILQLPRPFFCSVFYIHVCFHYVTIMHCVVTFDPELLLQEEFSSVCSRRVLNLPRPPSEMLAASKNLHKTRFYFQ